MFDMFAWEIMKMINQLSNAWQLIFFIKQGKFICIAPFRQKVTQSALQTQSDLIVAALVQKCRSLPLLRRVQKKQLFWIACKAN